jgi:predicted transcriptional regulator
MGESVKKTTATYIVESKRKLGNAAMSDRELGEHFSVSQQYISKAKSGNMSDSLAMKVAALISVDPGEVLLVARAEREVDQVVKAHLLSPSPVQAFGGEGGIRTHVTA